MISVHDSAEQKWHPRESAGAESADRKEHICQRKHLDDPQDFLENILWLDETNVECCGRFASCFIRLKTNRHFIKEHGETRWWYM